MVALAERERLLAAEHPAVIGLPLIEGKDTFPSHSSALLVVRLIFGVPGLLAHLTGVLHRSLLLPSTGTWPRHNSVKSFVLLLSLTFTAFDEAF